MEILSAILAEESAKKSDLEKALWLVRLTTWIRKTNENGLSESKIENLYTARLKYLLLLVNKNEAWKNNFVQTISDVLLRSSASLALTTVGISPHSSFLQDALGRVQNKLLPSAALSDDLSQLL